MAKLTKQEAKLHEQAEKLLEKDTLTFDDKLFILEHWQESATNVNSTHGAFFTPWGLASEFAMEASYHRDARIIDLCAGIGALSLAVLDLHKHRNITLDIVCVEMNPEYVAVGKKIVPEATWINSDVFDLPDLGRFDMAISNPPFGKIKTDHKPPRYKGAEFEYKILDLAGTIADTGAYIIPQGSAPFAFSGKQYFDRWEQQKYKKFHRETGIHIDIGCGLDTNQFRDQWKGVSPIVEVCTTEHF
ncbi:methyltransferase [Corynebacterium hindlerae]|uniref:Methyltransferase n=1 Tax=Corynebacterium hindlerae TaxID=699041 RepID=A0A7G5FIA9_9CORY|nr:methyltransferase [Corynebacterium hindlerae]QMV86350.1 methyltransferase [Corynebacterium hindlerae]